MRFALSNILLFINICIIIPMSVNYGVTMLNAITTILNASNEVINSMVNQQTGDMSFEYIVPQPRILFELQGYGKFIYPMEVFNEFKHYLATYHPSYSFTVDKEQNRFYFLDQNHKSFHDQMISNFAVDFTDIAEADPITYPKTAFEIEKGRNFYHNFRHEFLGDLVCINATSYRHLIDFREQKWNSKSDIMANARQGEIALFRNVLSFPKAILIALSKKFPQEVINVVYASDNSLIGGNLTFQDGEIVSGFTEKTATQQQLQDCITEVINKAKQLKIATGINPNQTRCN